jgi:acetate kinase
VPGNLLGIFFARRARNHARRGQILHVRTHAAAVAAAPGLPMETSVPAVLTINGGSSSIKFALFEARQPPLRLLEGRIEGIGQPEGNFEAAGAALPAPFAQAAAVPDRGAAVALLAGWIRQRLARGALAAVGHRVVHGGPRYWLPARVTPALLEELHRLSPFDPEHLPAEIMLIEAFGRLYPELPQVACFDTEFHHDLPPVARLLPIPREYEAKGIRRYGFHGLSCAYLMQELRRTAGVEAAQGRVVLAHLGNGASMTAVRGGKSIDTSMGMTPTGGLPMSSRSGDLDPGLAWYLARTERMTPERFHRMVNHESGLLGVSGISSDMRQLLSLERQDARAAQAVELFCYQARKWIGALAAACEGLDTLVFAGGIGENSPEVRERICRGLGFLGIELDDLRNRANAPLISTDAGPVPVRVIRTDEQVWVAAAVARELGLNAKDESHGNEST